MTLGLRLRTACLAIAAVATVLGALVPVLPTRAAGAAGTITTAAGPGSIGDGGMPTNAVLHAPQEVAFSGGNLYLADPGNKRIRKIAPGPDGVIGGPSDTDDVITTVAGDGSDCVNSTCGNGGPATQAQTAAYGVTLDANGNMYIADGADVRFVCEQSGGCTLPAGAGGPSVSSGTIISVAGPSGTVGTSGDGGPATSAGFFTTWAVTLDSAGNLWIADRNGQNVRFVCMQSTACTVYPKAPKQCGTNGMSSCTLTVAPGTIQTVAGSYLCKNATSTTTGSGAGGPAVKACFGYGPASLAFDNAGNVYISDDDAPGWIFGINLSTGTFSTVATGSTTYSPSTPMFTAEQLQWANTGGAGSLYVSDRANATILAFNLGTSTWTTVAGCATCTGHYGGDGGPATSALLDSPLGVVLDGSGNMYIADTGNNRIRKVTSGGTISTIAGTGGTTPPLGDGGPATAASLNAPQGVAYDSSHAILYIADYGDGRVRKVDSTGVITTVAGTGNTGHTGDGGPATSATFGLVVGLALDRTGNLYIADSYEVDVRFVCLQSTTCPTPFGPVPSGDIDTVAGDSNSAYSGDGGLATGAGLAPTGIALDGAGNLYIDDSRNNRIRAVCMQPSSCSIAGQSLASGDITTVAGSGAPCGSGASTWPCGDGGPATAAAFNQAGGLAVDSGGNVYIADTNDFALRYACLQATPCGLPWSSVPGASGGMIASGTITTVAGAGPASLGFSGDGSAAPSAQLTSPTGVSLDAAGNVYIGDAGNQRVRFICLQSSCPTYLGSTPIGPGIISTLAGIGGNGGYNGDNIPANQAALSQPTYLALDSANNVYISDFSNNRIREVTAPVTVEPYTRPLSGGFANQQVGTASAAQTVTFTNPTSSAVNVWVGAPSGSNGSDFAVTGTTCGTSSSSTVSVAANGGTCSAQVAFDPTGFGRRSATLAFNDGASTPPTAGLVGLADSTKVGVVGANLCGSGPPCGALYAKQDAQPYQSLGGVITATPTVVSVPGAPGTTPMTIYIGVGSDTNLYIRSDTQAWQAFAPPGTSCIDAPGAVVTPASGGGDTLTIACQGADHALYYAQTPVTAGTLPAIGAGGWVYLGGILNAGPAVTAIGGQITFIVTGGGGQLYQRGISTGYTAINGSCRDHVAVATTAAQTTAYLACHGSDDGLWLAVNAGSGWGAFANLGGVVQGSPAMAVTSTEVTIWVEGTDTALYHRTTNLAGTSPSGYVDDGGSVQLGAGGAGMIAT